MPDKQHHAMRLSVKIMVAMVLGVLVGLLFNVVSHPQFIHVYFVDGALDVVSKIFITLLKMLVVPIVFVSLICGVASLGNINKLGRMGFKTIILYLFTTAIAIALGLIFASLFGIGNSQHMGTNAQFALNSIPSLKQTFIEMFPSNPIAALAEGKMLQIIFFALLFGIAIVLAGQKGEKVKSFFESLNAVVMKLVTIVMYLMPYGVFALIAKQFAQAGFSLIISLAGYFATVLFVLLFHAFVTYSVFLRVLAKLNPIMFFRKLFPAMLFGFSTSSSGASIPVTLGVVENDIGVKNTVASFVIPLGATINMDGTAIMQGVATVFIANVYGIKLTLSKFIIVIMMATLASIGTAAVPSVGLITLAMVLQQVGLPVQGIAMIIGVDRILDMVRTSVNLTGDAMVATVVGKSEGELNLKTFSS